MLKITKACEVTKVSTIIVSLYGQPGIGKTSMSSTSNKSLLLDCDSGAYRSEFTGDRVEVKNWSDIVGITVEDIEGYDTIIIDTVGRALEFLSAALIIQNPKLSKKTGELTIAGYGAVKQSFRSWIGGLRTLNKDIVFVSHEKEERTGDDRIVRPDIQGGTYGEILKLADAMGYMYQEGQNRIIDFTPTDYHIGKDSGKIGKIIIPHFGQEPNFLSKIIQQIKDTLNRVSMENRKISQIVSAWRTRIDEIKNSEEANCFLLEIKEEKNPTVLTQVRGLLAKKTKNLGLRVNAHRQYELIVDCPDKKPESSETFCPTQACFTDCPVFTKYKR